MTSTFTPAFDINKTGTTSALGRELRLRRLFAADGKTVTVALDQAVPRGVAPRLATIGSTFANIAEGQPDAVTITKGLAGPLFGGNPNPVPWILKASMFSVEFHPTYDATIGSVEDAVKLGAEAVAVGISAGSANQVAMFEMLTNVVEEAHIWGLPVVCHAYPSGEMWGDRKGSTESVLYASRAAAELGTDIVKTWYTGSTAEFAKVVEGTPAIVVAAGGAPANSPLDVLKQAASVVEAGGHGMTCGRNIWQAENPAKMVSALKAVIHGGESPEVAAKILD
ncbi:fructose-bisphosphate aldolase [Mycolicibacterium peregrinum]|uniref:Fructose-bisphosphate aldolase n=1 Tax=Mycolicibacterium peregrinum TaxID=43304 RepID=A0A1A0RIL7_MYCPR|nr:fructose-bisphosphate aldolase [Mycolicibacterium peregrinum]OBB33544.1 fructose-bisphosphate aldolase [Mycolicibacterium peregrinum]